MAAHHHSDEVRQRIQRAREHYQTRAERRPQQRWDPVARRWEKVR
jgi:hypothetical protein